jgi:hypothetical protein
MFDVTPPEHVFRGKADRQYFNKPAFKTLLPDPLPPPHQRPYTLVIDLEHLLVSSSWDVSLFFDLSMESDV